MAVSLHVNVTDLAKLLAKHQCGSEKVIQSADIFVDAAGLIQVTDYNAGLQIIEYGG
jgi:hypothetical protein